MTQQELENDLIEKKLGGIVTRLGKKNLRRDVELMRGASRVTFDGVVYFDKEDPLDQEIGEWDRRNNRGRIY